MNRFRLIWATGAGLALLGGAMGCGQKGPLYLPERNGAVVTRPGGAPQTNGTPQPATQQPAQAPQTDATTPAPAQTGPKKKDSEDDSSANPKK